MGCTSSAEETQDKEYEAYKSSLESDRGADGAAAGAGGGAAGADGGHAPSATATVTGSTVTSVTSPRSVGFAADTSFESSNAGAHARNKTEERLSLAHALKKRVNLLEYIDARFAPTYHDKDEAALALIVASLRENYVFSDLTAEDRVDFARMMSEQRVTAGTEVIAQGDRMADFFYVIATGEFAVEKDGEELSRLSAGHSFGELALVYNAPRAATVRCVEDSTLWVLDRRSFRSTLAKAAEENKAQVHAALANVELLSPLNDKQLEAVADAMQYVTFEEGEQILRRGDEGNIFFIVKSGRVRVTDIGDGTAPDVFLGASAFFGERALLTGDVRAASVVADTRVQLLALPRADFELYIGPLATLRDQQQRMAIMDRIDAFRALSFEEKQDVCFKFRELSLSPLDVVFRQGEDPDAFYVVKSGEVEVWQGDARVSELPAGQRADSQLGVCIATIKENGFFGEAALVNHDKRSATVRCGPAPSELLVLMRGDFDAVVGSMSDVLERDITNRRMEAERAQEKAFARSLTLSDLQEVSVLGAGTFGKVSLMRHAGSGMTFALKALNKAQVQRLRQERNVVNEKRTLEECDSPFILTLYKTFLDESRVYLLTEFLQGGELFSVVHTHTRDGVPERSAKFYAAATLLGIAHLHDRGIAYRDLKPENIMIDAAGYSKLIDMGFAKKVRGKTFTMCGTPEYLCPEIVMGLGHNRAVDYWALGVLIYEMIVGISPFCPPSGADQAQIMRNIIHGKVKFPRNFSENAASLIRGLLRREPIHRMGMQRKGHREIAQHPWFDDISFHEMNAKHVDAPWVPAVKSPVDASNFIGYDIDQSFAHAPPMRTDWEVHFRP